MLRAVGHDGSICTVCEPILGYLGARYCPIWSLCCATWKHHLANHFPPLNLMTRYLPARYSDHPMRRPGSIGDSSIPMHFVSSAPRDFLISSPPSLCNAQTTSLSANSNCFPFLVPVVHLLLQATNSKAPVLSYAPSSLVPCVDRYQLPRRRSPFD